jgi:predicted nucleic acid-binding protein
MNEGKCFFDSNILIYSFDALSPVKRDRAQQLVDFKMHHSEAVVSFQVLQEFVNVMRKGKEPRMSVEVCQVYVASMLDQCEVVRPTKELLNAGLVIHKRFQVSWYDALIVAAAQISGCAVLYSEDLSDLQKYDSVQVINPFR